MRLLALIRYPLVAVAVLFLLVLAHALRERVGVREWFMVFGEAVGGEQ